MRRSRVKYVAGLFLCGICYVFLGGQGKECIDNDGDGYYVSTCGSECDPIDCDDTNPKVNPGATEGPEGDPSCSDGLDNNCDGEVDELDQDCVSSKWGSMVWGEDTWGGK